VKHCENCGSRVYNLGCVNCDEAAYIEEQDYITERDYVKLPDGRIVHRDDAPYYRTLEVERG